MDPFARVVVGVDGTEWGREALRQTLALAPPEAVVRAVTALRTGAAARTGFDAARWVHVLTEEAQRARDEAAAMLEGRTDRAPVSSTASPSPCCARRATRRVRRC